MFLAVGGGQFWAVALELLVAVEIVHTLACPSSHLQTVSYREYGRARECHCGPAAAPGYHALRCAATHIRGE